MTTTALPADLRIRIDQEEMTAVLRAARLDAAQMFSLRDAANQIVRAQGPNASMSVTVNTQPITVNAAAVVFAVNRVLRMSVTEMRGEGRLVR